MAFPNNISKLLLLLITILRFVRVKGDSIDSTCKLGVKTENKVYNFSLASPTPKYPHGILSEDGFYKVAVNDSVLWFQICDGMIFNHDPPRCFDCRDCGGQLHCGTTCSALVSNYFEGYYVCETIGRASSTKINLIDEKNPGTGIIVKMSNNGPQVNCSLSVSVFCDSDGLQGPNSFEKIGACDYSTSLKHPSGCAEIISAHSRGWGWFATLLTIILCLLGAYLLAGIVYRFFFLGVRGVEVIPNLDFWLSLPHRTKSLIGSCMRRFRRPSGAHRSSYSPVNF